MKYFKGKSTIARARRFGGRVKNFTGKVFLAQGYFVSTVGLGEGIVRKISATKSMRMNATQPNEIDV